MRHIGVPPLHISLSLHLWFRRKHLGIPFLIKFYRTNLVGSFFIIHMTNTVVIIRTRADITIDSHETSPQN
nr:MAG TPA: hypothetical protein [Caudoviricetes sp.]